MNPARLVRLTLAHTLFALVALTAASACHEGAKVEARSTSTPSATPRFVGRFDFSDPAGPRFAWSTSTIEASFTGTGLSMNLRAAPLDPHDVKIDGQRVTLHETTTSYTVRIDDASPFTIQVGPTQEHYELARDLDPARVHVASVTRDAEAFAGVHQFLGFEVREGALVPARARRLRLEIVGDSITCGYGILGKDASCPFTYATENASLAYGALLGRALDADVTTVCWSGRGIYRNYDIDGEPTMPELFELALPVPKGRPVRWSFDAAPKPHATVLHLGANDFFADGNGDGKPEPIDHAAFEQAFARFLARVRAVVGGAPVLVALAPMLKGPLREDARATLERVVRARRAAGDDRVELLELEEQGARVGCDSHPNAEMHRVLARQVEVALRAALARASPAHPASAAD